MGSPELGAVPPRETDLSILIPRPQAISSKIKISRGAEERGSRGEKNPLFPLAKLIQNIRG